MRTLLARFIVCYWFNTFGRFSNPYLKVNVAVLSNYQLVSIYHLDLLMHTFG